MAQRKISPLYRFIKWSVGLFYPKYQVSGAENLPPEPAVIVGNHSQMYGPMTCELYFPRNRYTWCVGQMMHRKEVPAYAYEDFWSRKPKIVRPFFKLASYVIAPLSECIFNSAQTIAVYRDGRLIQTFRESIQRLQEGADLVIFPEHDVPYNLILCDFQEHFVDLARVYYRRTGKELYFVPMYICPSLRRLMLGRPTQFRGTAPIQEERQRICAYLQSEITAMAKSLPVHRVVPYNNIPKREYPTTAALMEGQA